jgi:polyhydroxyalkanoate synthesis regulator phasin
MIEGFEELKHNLNSEIESEINEFKQEVEKLEAKMKEKISSICNKLDYKNSSVFSYNNDRIQQFAKEVKDFKISI